jgi:hypothetical protein
VRRGAYYEDVGQLQDEGYSVEDEPGRLRLPGRTDRCVSVETRFVLQAMIVGIGTAVEREVHRRSQRHISYIL